MQVAILFEDERPIRAFKGDSCIYKAYRWAHHHFHLNEQEPPLPLHKLPEYLEVRYYLMTEEKFEELTKP
jgi:hypothetical protein